MSNRSREAAKGNFLRRQFRPLTGLLVIAHFSPRLTPWATLFRHTVADGFVPLLPRRLHDFHRALWQRVEKRLAIALREDPVVQHDHDAAVRLRADQPPHALTEFQDGLR